MEKCFWCGCEIIGTPNHLKDFGYVCDKDYQEMGYNDITPEFEKAFRKDFRKFLVKGDKNE